MLTTWVRTTERRARGASADKPFEAATPPAVRIRRQQPSLLSSCTRRWLALARFLPTSSTAEIEEPMRLYADLGRVRSRVPARNQPRGHWTTRFLTRLAVYGDNHWDPEAIQGNIIDYVRTRRAARNTRHVSCSLRTDCGCDEFLELRKRPSQKRSWRKMTHDHRPKFGSPPPCMSIAVLPRRRKSKYSASCRWSLRRREPAPGGGLVSQPSSPSHEASSSKCRRDRVFVARVTRGPVVEDHTTIFRRRLQCDHQRRGSLPIPL